VSGPHRVVENFPRQNAGGVEDLDTEKATVPVEIEHEVWRL
jgi:hypothetical protein